LRHGESMLKRQNLKMRLPRNSPSGEFLAVTGGGQSRESVKNSRNSLSDKGIHLRKGIRECGLETQETERKGNLKMRLYAVSTCGGFRWRWRCATACAVRSWDVEWGIRRDATGDKGPLLSLNSGDITAEAQRIIEIRRGRQRKQRVIFVEKAEDAEMQCLAALPAARNGITAMMDEIATSSTSWTPRNDTIHEPGKRDPMIGPGCAWGKTCANATFGLDLLPGNLTGGKRR
jgi:hypothetical protein